MGKAIPVDLGVVSFKSRSKARVHFQGILQSYSVGDRVSEEHGRQLVELLKLHPEAASKIGSGVSHFEVLGADFDTQCFHFHLVTTAHIAGLVHRLFLGRVDGAGPLAAFPLHSPAVRVRNHVDVLLGHTCLLVMPTDRP